MGNHYEIFEGPFETIKQKIEVEKEMNEMRANGYREKRTQIFFQGEGEDRTTRIFVLFSKILD